MMSKRKDGQMTSKYKNSLNSVQCLLQLKFDYNLFFSGSCPEITAKVTKILSNKEYFKMLALMIPPWFAVGLG